MKRTKPMYLLLLLVILLNFDTTAQNQSFYRLNLPPYCAGSSVKYKINNIWDFYDGYNNTGHPKYFELTVSGPGVPALYGKQYLNNHLVGTSLTVEFFLLNTNNWFNTTDLNIHITGFYSLDGGNTFIEIPGSYSDILPIHNTFPDIDGPVWLSSPSNVQYSVPAINASVTYNWTLPNGWNNLSNPGSSILAQPANQAGNVGLTTSPAVDACNYPASLPVTISSCFNQGTTDHEFCAPQAWYKNALPSAYGSQNNNPVRMGDFDGDGNQDIVVFQDNVKVFTNPSGGYFQGPSVWNTVLVGVPQTTYPRMVGDFNGDGKDDIIAFGYWATEVGVSSNNSFNTSLFSAYGGFTYAQGYTNRNVVQRLIGDFDGNGMDDIVGFGYSLHAVALSNGSSFSTANFTGGYEFTANGMHQMNDMNKYPKMVGDFNGDGKDDVIGFGHSNVMVGLSTGSDFNFSNWTGMLTFEDGFTQQERPRMLGDFNGDGKDDIIGFGDNSVIVGLSNGVNGFNMNTWLMSYFTPATGWEVDGREIGVEFIPWNSVNPDQIFIADMNGDGLDDIVGFKDGHTWVSHSTGYKFLCPEPYNALGSATKHMPILVGNFDASDDAAEIVQLRTSSDYYQAADLYYMNCNACDAAIAEAQLINSNGSHQESGFYTLDVHDYCEDVVAIDVTGTTCQNAYNVEIHEFDISTHTSINTVFTTGWIDGTPPTQIDISSMFTFQPNVLYMVIFHVGYNLDAEYMWLRMDAQLPSGQIELTNDQGSRLHETKSGQFAVVNYYCLDKNSMAMQATASQCYDSYRFELVEVNTSLTPISAPLQQYPAGGSWNQGPLPNYVYISTSNMILGKMYRIQMFLQNDVGTTVTTRYVEFDDCIAGPPRLPKGRNGNISDNSDNPTSILYPNPFSSQRLNIQVGYYEEKTVLGVIYSIDGKELKSMELNSNDITSIDLTDLLPATYILKIIGNNNMEILRFTKTEH